MGSVHNLPKKTLLIIFELPPGWLYDDVVERLGASGLTDFLLCHSLAGRLVATIRGGVPKRVEALHAEATAMGLRHVETKTVGPEDF